jgi:HEAT repeat protein
MNDKYEELIAEYLNGELDENKKAEVEALIASGEIDMIDFKAMEQLHNELEMVSTPEPSSELSNKFYAMLEDEKAELKPVFNLSEKINALFEALTMPRLAYAFVLLIVGGFIGSQFGNNSSQIDQLTSQMQDMREMMVVSMLEGASTTDRLRAVNISAQLPLADEKAVRALLFTLNNDESVNVRVQTIEALKRWGEDETVRKGLVNAIGVQNSDVVIIALADAMVELGLDNSKQEFEDLINERELNFSVKEKLVSTIALL